MFPMPTVCGMCKFGETRACILRWLRTTTKRAHLEDFCGRRGPCQYLAALSKNNIVHFYGEHGLWPRYKQSRPLKKGAFHYAVTNNVPIVMIVYLFGKKRVTAQILEPIYPNATLNKKEAVDDLQHRTQKAYDDAVIKFYHYDRETYAMNKVNEPVKKRKNK